MIRPIALLMICLLASPALAHKVIFDAYASGPNVEGELGFSNGEMADGHTIYVETLDGAPLGQTITDADGFFLFTPSQAVPHLFKADLGAGHVAQTVLSVADLPKTLRPASVASATAAASLMDPDAGLQGVSAFNAAQTDLIAEMLRDELRPMRRELASYREKNDLQSIIGGIGYIVGIFGIGFYVAARRKLKT